jgi:hypothetical protein
MLLACALPATAQEADHFYEFFEKGQVVHISSSSAESQFLSAVILTSEDYQRVTDSQSLSVDEMVKKYPDLSAKMDEALKGWPAEVREARKAKLVFYQPVLQLGGYYRVITAKSDYLLVESLSSQRGKVVYALDKIKTISWNQGLKMREDPGDSTRARR